MKIKEIILRGILISAAFFLLASHVSAGGRSLSAKPVLRIETGVHSARIFKMDSDRENRFLVTGGEDKTVRLWELPSGRPLTVLRPPVGPGNDGVIRAVAISPDGARIAYGGVTPGLKGFNVWIYNRETGRMADVITGLPEPVLHLSFSKDGRFLAAALMGKAGIRVYRTQDCTTVSVADGGYSGISSGADFDGSGRLITVSFDGMARLYDSSFKLIGKATLPGGKTPSSVRFSPDGSKAAVGFYDYPHIDILSGKDLSPISSRTLPGDMVLSVAWSADGSYLYGSNAGKKGPFILARFGGGGTGPLERIVVERGGDRSTRSTKTALCCLRDGSVAFANREPAIGIVNNAGGNVLYKDAAALWFTSDDGLLASPDGTVVQFTGLADTKKPVRFSLADRRLDEIAGTGYAPVELFKPDPGTGQIRITDWRSSEEPRLNGKPIKLRRGEFSVTRAVASDGSHFVIGTNFGIYLFDRSGSEVWRVPFSGVRCVNIPPSGQVIVAASSDGTIHWHRVKDGKTLLTLFPGKDMKRWVVWTPSGYYDAAPGAEELIGWHINRGDKLAADFFPVSRFRSTYYRPDVVAKTLELKDEKEALATAGKESGRPTEDAAIEKVLPPVVSIVHPRDGAEVNDTDVAIRFTVRSPSGDPVTGIRVLVDGRPVQRLRGVDAQGEELREIAVRVPERDSEVSVFASNKNAVSEPSTIHLKWQGPAFAGKTAPLSPMAMPQKGTPGRSEAQEQIGKSQKSVGNAPAVKIAAKPDEFVIKPKLYILAIGVSNYQDKELKLGFAAKDADDFANVMSRQKGELYRDIIITRLTDEKATKDEILDGLDWITKETTSKDIAMVFLAGHGMNDPNGIYYFLPVNTDLDKLKRTGLAFSEIKNTVISLAGKTILFVDSCHSGNVMGSRRAVADINALVNELSSAENGAVVFSSSSGRQYSVEDAAWGNGAFTKALVEGIGGKADFMGKGRITINMLDLYLSERVKELTKGKQTPTTAKPTTVADFPIALLAGK